MYSVVRSAHSPAINLPQPEGHEGGGGMYQYTDCPPGAGPQKGNGTRQERAQPGGRNRSNSLIRRAYIPDPVSVGLETALASESPMAPIYPGRVTKSVR
jgi:hypothetical protein